LSLLVELAVLRPGLRQGLAGETGFVATLVAHLTGHFPHVRHVAAQLLGLVASELSDGEVDRLAGEMDKMVAATAEQGHSALTLNAAEGAAHGIGELLAWCSPVLVASGRYEACVGSLFRCLAMGVQKHVPGMTLATAAAIALGVAGAAGALSTLPRGVLPKKEEDETTEETKREKAPEKEDEKDEEMKSEEAPATTATTATDPIAPTSDSGNPWSGMDTPTPPAEGPDPVAKKAKTSAATEAAADGASILPQIPTRCGLIGMLAVLIPRLQGDKSKLQESCLSCLGRAMLRENDAALLAAAAEVVFSVSREQNTELGFCGGEALALIAGSWPEEYRWEDPCALEPLHSCRNAAATHEAPALRFDAPMAMILERCLTKYAGDPNKYARQNAAIWVLSLIKHGGRHPSLQERLDLVHARLSALLGDPHDFTQEVASRSLSLLYEVGSEEVKDKLVASLVDQFSGQARAPVRVGATDAFIEQSFGGATKGAIASCCTGWTCLSQCPLPATHPAYTRTCIGLSELHLLPDRRGHALQRALIVIITIYGHITLDSTGEVTSYKELCSLAADMGQPDVVYQFLDVANHHASWNTKRGAAFAIADQGRDRLQPHLAALIPKLYR